MQVIIVPSIGGVNTGAGGSALRLGRLSTTTLAAETETVTVGVPCALGADEVSTE